MSKSNENLITVHTLQNLLYNFYHFIFKVIVFSLQKKKCINKCTQNTKYWDKISGPYFLVVYNQKQSIRKYLGHKYFTNVTMIFRFM